MEEVKSKCEFRILLFQTIFWIALISLLLISNEFIHGLAIAEMGLIKSDSFVSETVDFLLMLCDGIICIEMRRRIKIERDFLNLVLTKGRDVQSTR